MKIQLQFEDSDLEEMVTFYFKDKGFAVKNMEDIASAFSEAFPEGLKVMAAVISIPPAAAVPEVDVAHADTLDPPPPVRRDSTRVLKVSDLRDPTLTDNFPTRDEQLRQEQRELDRILKRSTELEKE